MFSPLILLLAALPRFAIPGPVPRLSHGRRLAPRQFVNGTSLSLNPVLSISSSSTSIVSLDFGSAQPTSSFDPQSFTTDASTSVLSKPAVQEVTLSFPASSTSTTLTNTASLASTSPPLATFSSSSDTSTSKATFLNTLLSNSKSVDIGTATLQITTTPPIPATATDPSSISTSSTSIFSTSSGQAAARLFSIGDFNRSSTAVTSTGSFTSTTLVTLTFNAQTPSSTSVSTRTPFVLSNAAGLSTSVISTSTQNTLQTTLSSSSSASAARPFITIEPILSSTTLISTQSIEVPIASTVVSSTKATSIITVTLSDTLAPAILTTPVVPEIASIPIISESQTSVIVLSFPTLTSRLSTVVPPSPAATVPSLVFFTPSADTQAVTAVVTRSSTTIDQGPAITIIPVFTGPNGGFVFAQTTTETVTDKETLTVKETITVSQ